AEPQLVVRIAGHDVTVVGDDAAIGLLALVALREQRRVARPADHGEAVERGDQTARRERPAEAGPAQLLGPGWRERRPGEREHEDGGADAEDEVRASGACLEAC